MGLTTSNPIDQQKRRARITAIVLAFSMILSIVCLVFAFMQKENAEKANEELLHNQVLANQLKEQLMQAQKEARAERIRAEMSEKNALECMINCKKR